MKKIIASISALLVAGAATAGTLTDPIVESTVQEAASSSSGALLPLLLIAGVAAVIALNN